MFNRRLSVEWSIATIDVAALGWSTRHGGEVRRLRIGGIMKRQDATRDPRGWGPFSGRQLTTVIVALVVGVLGYPFAAGAASAVFTSE